MVSPDAAPERAAGPVPAAPSGSSAGAADGLVAPVPAARVASAREPLLPERSSEDTDAAWGEYPEPADDRLYRDRPPHWADY